MNNAEQNLQEKKELNKYIKEFNKKENDRIKLKNEEIERKLQEAKKRKAPNAFLWFLSFLSFLVITDIQGSPFIFTIPFLIGGAIIPAVIISIFTQRFSVKVVFIISLLILFLVSFGKLHQSTYNF